MWRQPVRQIRGKRITRRGLIIDWFKKKFQNQYKIENKSN